MKAPRARSQRRFLVFRSAKERPAAWHSNAERKIDYMTVLGGAFIRLAPVYFALYPPSTGRTWPVT